MRAVYLITLLAMSLAVARPPQADLTLFVSLAWSQPGSEAVLFWSGAQSGACAYRVAPLPRVLLDCATPADPTKHTVILRTGDPDPDKHPSVGMRVTLEDALGNVLAERQLAPEVNQAFLPFVAIP